MSERVVVTALLVLALPASALADREKVRLVYLRDVTAEVCPAAQELAAGVATELGYDPFSDEATRTARVAIAMRGSTFVARIELDDSSGARGSRELGAATCEELAPAIVLAIGLAIDPLLLLRKGGPPALPPPVRERPAQADDAEVPPRASAEILDRRTIERIATTTPRGVAPSASFTVLAAAGVLATFDAAPATTAGFFLDLGLAHAWWQLSLEWRGDLPSTGPVVAGGRVRESMVGAMLAPCVRRRWVAVCALIGVGSEIAIGLGYSEARSVNTVWAAAGGRLAFEIPVVGRWRISLRTDLLAPLARAELVVGPDVVWRTRALTSALGAAVVAQLW